jgi:hypothetical protein
MTAIADLIPAGCSVERTGQVTTVHDTEGNVIAIVNAGKNNLEIARLIAALPDFIRSIDDAIERGAMLPIYYGMRNLDSAVFQPKLRPSAYPAVSRWE